MVASLKEVPSSLKDELKGYGISIVDNLRLGNKEDIEKFKAIVRE
jgi:hypothetical protein